MERRHRYAWVVLGAGMAAVAVAALSLRPEPPAPVPHRLESDDAWPELADASVVQTAFELVRAELYGDPPPPADALAAHRGRDTYVCAYGLTHQPLCAGGAGPTLRAAVQDAARTLGSRRDDWTTRRDAIRLKIDVVTDTSVETYPGPTRPHDYGVYGFVVERSGQRSFVLPSQVLELPVVYKTGGQLRLLRPLLIGALMAQNPELGELPSRFPFTRIWTVAWVEAASGSGIVRLYRLHPFDQEDITADLLLQRSIWAADYLLSATRAEGSIRYLYTPTSDKEPDGYNLLRHGGTTYSLLQAYRRTGFEPYLRASEQAIRYLLSHSKSDQRTGPYGGGKALHVVEGDYVKLGGAGLALLMLSEYADATGDDTFEQQARGYATFLVAMQRKSGEFISYASREPGGRHSPKVMEYFPGEAILGLVRHYRHDPDPLWLATAQRGADWLIDVRDRGLGPTELSNDHWLMMALAWLYAADPNQRYLEHALALARAVEHQQGEHDEHWQYHRDYRGGYYEPPRSTPAATRSEGLVAVLDTCALADVDCGWVEEVLHRTLRHQLQSQYTPDASWWLPNPSIAFGAFHGGIHDVEVRNDFVQHNLSAVLGAERLLRTRDGAPTPGGPPGTPPAGRTTPLLQSALGTLRKATVEARGTTRWEAERAAPDERDR